MLEGFLESCIGRPLFSLKAKKVYADEQQVAESDEATLRIAELQKDLENCRVCVDIEAWQAKARQITQRSFLRRHPHQPKESPTPASTANDRAGQVEQQQSDTLLEAELECPPDAGELGRSTWTFLHTLSTSYPRHPTPTQQSDMLTFLRILGDVYPCKACAKDFCSEMLKSPPRVESREALMLWLCQQHNLVNERLGKEQFDCAQVWRRWHGDSGSDAHCSQ